MNKVLAYTALHYGKEYLPYAVESVIDQVDKVLILYTPRPSYGHETERTNPDSKEELQECLAPFGDKIVWREVWANAENVHRASAESYAKIEEYDVMLALDYDEVWDSGALREAIEYASTHPEKEYRVPFIHFWKDFNHVCRDAAQPVRLINLKGEGTGYIPLPKPVYHFGYAISDELMYYKIDIHGHRGEWRAGWFESTWRPGDKVIALEDVHPTCEQGFWNVEPFDKTELPEIMRKHPKYD